MTQQKNCSNGSAVHGPWTAARSGPGGRLGPPSPRSGGSGPARPAAPVRRVRRLRSGASGGPVPAAPVRDGPARRAGPFPDLVFPTGNSCDIFTAKQLQPFFFAPGKHLIFASLLGELLNNGKRHLNNSELLKRLLPLFGAKAMLSSFWVKLVWSPTRTSRFSIKTICVLITITLHCTDHLFKCTNKYKKYLQRVQALQFL